MLSTSRPHHHHNLSFTSSSPHTPPPQPPEHEHSRLPVPLSARKASHVDGWTRWRETAQGAPAAFLPEALGALIEDGTGAGPPPQRAAGRGAKRGCGARDERRPMGTEASTQGQAAGSPAGARAAKRDSHGWLSGCPGASPRRRWLVATTSTAPPSGSSSSRP